MSNSTGQGSTLIAGNAALKFGATEAYEVTRISRVFGRKVAVIPDGHLGQAAGSAALTCPGDIVTIDPITVDVKQDFENTTRFADQTAANGIKNPMPLGTPTGTATSDMFLLTLKGGVETSDFATVRFSGFIFEDSGFELKENRKDRLLSTLKIQPDGQSIVWADAGA